MKALSIKQPWASLIAHGIKDIENRTWKTNFRGRIYIHASTECNVEFDFLQMTELMKDKNIDLAWYIKKSNVPIRAIIGEADIVDCVINHPSIWAEKTEGVTAGNIFFHDDSTKPIWNWVLANAVLYDKPILNVKGKLSFWEFEK